MQEKDIKLSPGLPVLILVLFVPFLAGFLIWMSANAKTPLLGGAAGALLLLWLISLPGFLIVNPNEARVIQLFGTYVGTVKDVGFYYGNPFYSKTKISMRVQTFETGVTETPETKDAAGKVLQSATRR